MPDNALSRSQVETRLVLAEDAEDLAAFRDRAREPTLAFEDLIRDMRRRGKL